MLICADPHNRLWHGSVEAHNVRAYGKEQERACAVHQCVVVPAMQNHVGLAPTRARPGRDFSWMPDKSLGHQQRAGIIQEPYIACI